MSFFQVCVAPSLLFEIKMQACCTLVLNVRPFHASVSLFHDYAFFAICSRNKFVPLISASGDSASGSSAGASAMIQSVKRRHCQQKANRLTVAAKLPTANPLPHLKHTYLQVYLSLEGSHIRIQIQLTACSICITASDETSSAMHAYSNCRMHREVLNDSWMQALHTVLHEMWV